MSINAVIVSYSMLYLVECGSGGGGGREEKLDSSSNTANAVRHARTIQTPERHLLIIISTAPPPPAPRAAPPPLAPRPGEFHFAGGVFQILPKSHK